MKKNYYQLIKHNIENIFNLKLNFIVKTKQLTIYFRY